MSKLLLLSRIGESIFVLKSSADCNSDFAYHQKRKKRREKKKVSFCSRLKRYILMVLTQ